MSDKAKALDPQRLAFEDWADERWGREAYRHKSDTSGEWEAWKAATARERARCALICDTTPPYPFRPSIEAAHAIRAAAALAGAAGAGDSHD